MCAHQPVGVTEEQPFLYGSDTQIHCLQCCNTEYKPAAYIGAGRGGGCWRFPYLSCYCFLRLPEPLPVGVTGRCPDCVVCGMVTPTTLLSVIRCGTGLFGSRQVDQVTALCFH